MAARARTKSRGIARVYICPVCNSPFSTIRGSQITCGRSCAGRRARAAPSQLACKCGKPASRKGWCEGCSLKRKRASRRRSYYNHRDAILKKRHDRWVSDADLRENHKVGSIRRRFNGLRASVLERDQYRCRKCSADEPLVVRHIIRVDRRVTDNKSTIDQLLTLCRACHLACQANPSALLVCAPTKPSTSKP